MTVSEVTAGEKKGGITKNNIIKEKTIISYNVDLCFIFDSNVL